MLHKTKWYGCTSLFLFQLSAVIPPGIITYLTAIKILKEWHSFHIKQKTPALSTSLGYTIFRHFCFLQLHLRVLFEESARVRFLNMTRMTKLSCCKFSLNCVFRNPCPIYMTSENDLTLRRCEYSNLKGSSIYTMLFLITRYSFEFQSRRLLIIANENKFQINSNEIITSKSTPQSWIMRQDIYILFVKEEQLR